MNIFEIFKGLFDRTKEENNLDPIQLRWNKMWDMWASLEAPSPYSELMTYQAEVSDGGHKQFFESVHSVTDIQDELDAILSLLDGVLADNLLRAIDAFSNSDNQEYMDKIFKECDSVFFENQERIDNVLINYANTLEI